MIRNTVQSILIGMMLIASVTTHCSNTNASAGRTFVTSVKEEAKLRASQLQSFAHASHEEAKKGASQVAILVKNAGRHSMDFVARHKVAIGIASGVVLLWTAYFMAQGDLPYKWRMSFRKSLGLRRAPTRESWFGNPYVLGKNPNNPNN